MNAASIKKWDIVNLLLRKGANVKLLSQVCFYFYLEGKYFFNLQN
jgi:hypothetical protein